MRSIACLQRCFHVKLQGRLGKDNAGITPGFLFIDLYYSEIEGVQVPNSASWLVLP